MFKEIVSVVPLILTSLLGAEVRPVPSTQHDFAVTLVTTNGHATAFAREMLLDVDSSNAKLGRKQFVVVFEPSTSRYIWLAAYMFGEEAQAPGYSRSFSDNSCIGYSENTQLTLFWTAFPSLVAIESKAMANSLDAATEISLREVRNIEREMERAMTTKVDERPDWKRLRIISLKLDKGFFSPPLSATVGPLHLRAIDRREGRWEVELEGQWKERVFLSDEFVMVGSERLK